MRPRHKSRLIRWSAYTPSFGVSTYPPRDRGDDEPHGVAITAIRIDYERALDALTEAVRVHTAGDTTIDLDATAGAVGYRYGAVLGRLPPEMVCYLADSSGETSVADATELLARQNSDAAAALAEAAVRSHTPRAERDELLRRHEAALSLLTPAARIDVVRDLGLNLDAARLESAAPLAERKREDHPDVSAGWRCLYCDYLNVVTAPICDVCDAAFESAGLGTA